jgi:hypothetical protein
MIWDPGGFQPQRWESHEQELMNFAAEQFDAGASLHISQPASLTNEFRLHVKERRSPHLKSELNVI